jgi:hypothetical protein
MALAGRLLVMQPQIADEQRQHLPPPDLGAAERERLLGEQPIEGLDIDLRALESGPGVLQMIGGVGAADDVDGEAALTLEARERLERRGGQHAAEIPDHRLDHRCSAIWSLRSD